MDRRERQDRISVSIFPIAMIALVICFGMSVRQAHAYEVHRTGGTVFVCKDSAGEVPDTNHNEWQTLDECGDKADQYGRIFEAVPGAVYTYTPDEATTEPPDEDPPVEPEPPVEPTSDILASFTATSDGTLTPWPADAVEALETANRIELTFTTTEAPGEKTSQWIIDLGNFAVWLYEDELHSNYTEGDVTTTLRIPFAAIEAGQQHTLVVQWAPTLIEILDGELAILAPGTRPEFSQPTYGLRPSDSGRPFTGEIKVELYSETVAVDPCSGELGTIDSATIARPVECPIAWIPPTEREDGTALDGISIYQVYAGNEMVLATPATETLVDAGCYRVTALDLNGLESDKSDQACRSD